MSRMPAPITMKLSTRATRSWAAMIGERDHDDERREYGDEAGEEPFEQAEALDGVEDRVRERETLVEDAGRVQVGQARRGRAGLPEARDDRGDPGVPAEQERIEEPHRHHLAQEAR